LLCKLRFFRKKTMRRFDDFTPLGWLVVGGSLLLLANSLVRLANDWQGHQVANLTNSTLPPTVAPVFMLLVAAIVSKGWHRR
jgi:hypothetical protein